jgi:N-acetylmuramoyl-L-alanine amidase
MRANNMKSSGVKIGQVLIIPGSNSPIEIAKTTNPVETEVITHVVKSGEYLGKIANKYKVSVASIKQQNKLKKETLWVGQKLKITVKLTDLPIRKHKVARGEFLSKIAKKYGVTVQSLRQANKLRSDSLAIGQILIIPNK